MKRNRIIAALAAIAIALAPSALTAQAQSFGSSPGIAMAGSANVSQLPEKAKSFIDKHFKDVAVRTCEKYYAKGKYEVELVNGVDLEFNTKGEILEIDAPGNTVIAQTVVKDIIPHKAYARLEQDGLIDSVESIEFKKGKVYEIDLRIPGPDTYLFTPEGVFIAIED
ncbi:MAG: PepSY-like domain-containing protein [Clostridium sp.]|nr:PepSY-like domain-containing protein [Clostridium sp.]